MLRENILRWSELDNVASGAGTIRRDNRRTSILYPVGRVDNAQALSPDGKPVALLGRVGSNPTPGAKLPILLM